MPLFQFEALQERGQKIRGVIEADSFLAAKEQLRLRRLLITRVAPYTAREKRKTVAPAQRLILTRLLNQLLAAKIPLYEALTLLEERYRRLSLHACVVDLCDRIKKGETFSSALAHQGGSFDPIYLAMVKAGEQGGNLPQAMAHLEHLMEERSRLRKQLFAALAYPLFLGAFCAAVFLSLLLGVIPSLKNLFEGRALHPLTRSVFKMSDFFLTHCHLLLFLSCAGCAILGMALFHPRFRPLWDRLLLRLPGIKRVVRLTAALRFCKSCGLLLEGGTPLVQALDLSTGVLNNRLLEEAAQLTQRRVSEGAPLSAHLEWMPSMVAKMVALGERTGQTAPLLRQSARLCEEEVSQLLRTFTSLLQPILLVVLGLFIGMTLLSVLIPLTDVSSVLER